MTHGDLFAGRDEKRKFGWETDFKKAYAKTIEQKRSAILSNLKGIALPEPRKALTEGRGV